MEIGTQKVFLELAERKKLELKTALGLSEKLYIPIQFPASPPCFFVLSHLLSWPVPPGLAVCTVFWGQIGKVLSF